MGSDGHGSRLKVTLWRDLVGILYLTMMRIQEERVVHCLSRKFLLHLKKQGQEGSHRIQVQLAFSLPVCKNFLFWLP